MYALSKYKNALYTLSLLLFSFSTGQKIAGSKQKQSTTLSLTEEKKTLSKQKKRSMRKGGKGVDDKKGDRKLSNRKESKAGHKKNSRNSSKKSIKKEKSASKLNLSKTMRSLASNSIEALKNNPFRAVFTFLCAGCFIFYTAVLDGRWYNLPIKYYAMRDHISGGRLVAEHLHQAHPSELKNPIKEFVQWLQLLGQKNPARDQYDIKATQKVIDEFRSIVLMEREDSWVSKLPLGKYLSLFIPAFLHPEEKLVFKYAIDNLEDCLDSFDGSGAIRGDQAELYKSYESLRAAIILRKMKILKRNGVTAASSYDALLFEMFAHVCSGKLMNDDLAAIFAGYGNQQGLVAARDLMHFLCRELEITDLGEVGALAQLRGDAWRGAVTALEKFIQSLGLLQVEGDENAVQETMVNYACLFIRKATQNPQLKDNGTLSFEKSAGLFYLADDSRQKACESVKKKINKIMTSLYGVPGATVDDLPIEGMGCMIGKKITPFNRNDCDVLIRFYTYVLSRCLTKEEENFVEKGESEKLKIPALKMLIKMKKIEIELITGTGYVFDNEDALDRFINLHWNTIEEKGNFKVLPDIDEYKRGFIEEEMVRCRSLGLVKIKDDADDEKKEDDLDGE